MIKKLFASFLLFTVISLTAATDLLAQSRINFKRGRNSATVSGTLRPGASRTYLLRASEGQSVVATLSSRNGKVDFLDRSVHDTQFSHTVEYNGDVRIRIDNHGSTTTYQLTVSIQ